MKFKAVCIFLCVYSSTKNTCHPSFCLHCLLTVVILPGLTCGCFVNHASLTSIRLVENPSDLVWTPIRLIDNFTGLTVNPVGLTENPVFSVETQLASLGFFKTHMSVSKKYSHSDNRLLICWNRCLALLTKLGLIVSTPVSGSKISPGHSPIYYYLYADRPHITEILLTSA